MAKRQDIEERHAKRLADGWRLVGWSIYFDAAGGWAPTIENDEAFRLIGGPMHGSWGPSPYEPSRDDFEWWSARFGLGLDVDLKAESQKVARALRLMRKAFEHRRCGCKQCKAPRVTRWLLTRMYRRAKRAAKL